MKITEKFLLDNGFDRKPSVFLDFYYKGFNIVMWLEGKMWKMKSNSDFPLPQTKIYDAVTIEDFISNVKKINTLEIVNNLNHLT